MMTSAQRNFLTGSFNPMSLSPALWLSDTGSDPGVWPDLSGNGRNGVQATPANQPDIIANGLNGRQVRRFNGVGDFMTHGLSGSLSGSFSIFIVTKLIALDSGYRTLFTCGDAAQGSLLVAKSGVTGRWGTYTGTDASATSTLITGQTVLLEMIDSAAAGGAFFLNGISDGVWSGNTVGQTSTNIGGSPSISQQTNCDIAEILIFPTALSDPDRQKVEAYLRAKWDIPFNPLLLSPALWLSDTGSDPAVWPDISGNGRNATQSDPNRRPAIMTGGLNGRQVRRFDGVDDSLSLTTGLGMFRNVPGATVIAVYKWISNPLIFKPIFLVGTDTGLTRYTIGGGIVARKLATGGRRLDSDSFARAESNVDNPTSFFIQSGVIDYANSDAFQYVNGTLDAVNTSFQTNGNTSNTDSFGITIGSAIADLTACANVEIAELIVFSTALSLTDRQNVEAYLKNKWMPDFNPLSLSPALWLSDTGSEPGVWPDISGNGRNATQATTTSQPAIVTGGLNGRQVRRFDGTDDCLFYPDFHTANITIFAVYKPANNGNVQTLLRKGFTTGISGEYNMRSNNATTVLFGLPSAFTSSTKIAGGNWIVQAGWADSSFVSSSVNGGSVTSVSGASAIPDNSFRGRIGSSYASESDTAGFAQVLLGDIAEILIFPTALSDTNRQRVEAYLKNKWMPDFNPLSLSPALWLSDTGSDAGVWSDISGNGRNATQATTANQPAIVTNVRNGRQIRRFNGTNQRLDVATLDPKTIFAVVNTTTTSTYRSVFGSRSSDAGAVDAVYLQAGIPARTTTFARATIVDTIGASDLIATAGVIGSGVWSIISGVRTDTSIQAFLDGVGGAVDTTVNALKNTTASVIGAAYYNDAIADFWPGDIAEIIIFTTTLSTTDRQAVESYLRTKWGTP